MKRRTIAWSVPSTAIPAAKNTNPGTTGNRLPIAPRIRSATPITVRAMCLKSYGRA